MYKDASVPFFRLCVPVGFLCDCPERAAAFFAVVFGVDRLRRMVGIGALLFCAGVRVPVGVFVRSGGRGGGGGGGGSVSIHPRVRAGGRWLGVGCGEQVVPADVLLEEFGDVQGRVVPLQRRRLALPFLSSFAFWKTPTEGSQETGLVIFGEGPKRFSTGTLVPADALNRLTGNLTVELEELVGNRRQDLDLTETTWRDKKGDRWGKRREATRILTDRIDGF